jgi:hypothetical protein
MKFISITFLKIILLGWIIPIIMSFVVYQGFSTNYSGRVFSEKSFRSQYEKGVFKYRVVGRYALLRTFDYIKQNSLPTVSPHSLKLLDENGDPQFYSAYFYLNTIFLCLTCTALFFVLGGANKNSSFMTLEIPILFLCFLMTITQYAVVPYDILSYFFLSTAVLLIIRKNQGLPIILTLGIIVILATLTRETAILILAFYFAHNYGLLLEKPVSVRLNDQQKAFIFISMCFILVYIGLRVVFGYEHAMFEAIMASSNDVFANAGILLLVSVSLLVLVTKPLTKEITAFFIASLAYILPVLLVANPSEIRLWTPLILLFTILKARAYPLPVSFPESQTLAD